MPRASQTPADLLPHSLRRDIERAGYYPALVADVVAEAACGEEVVEHLVHQETTFDHDGILRHVTVLVLTPSRLVVGHVDDHVDAASSAGVPRTGRAADRPVDTVVTATSESGNSYTITKAGATITRSCAVAAGQDRGGCKTGNVW